MNVAELIEQLQNKPQWMPVHIVKFEEFPNPDKGLVYKQIDEDDVHEYSGKNFGIYLG